MQNKTETTIDSNDTHMLSEPFEAVGQLDVEASILEDNWKKAFMPDKTLHGQGNDPLGKFSNFSVTIYRGQTPSGLYIVPDFDFQTYGWNFPYTYFELQLNTMEGVRLELFSFRIEGAHSACPARTVHFNHTYRASSDYFGVVQNFGLNYKPLNPIIPRC